MTITLELGRRKRIEVNGGGGIARDMQLRVFARNTMIARRKTRMERIVICRYMNGDDMLSCSTHISLNPNNCFINFSFSVAMHGYFASMLWSVVVSMMHNDTKKGLQTGLLEDTNIQFR